MVNIKRLLILATLFFAGCSGLPKTMRDTPYTPISLYKVKINISAHENTPLRWGGTIVNVTNEKDSSQAQLLYYPISRYGRPRTDRKTEGRFAISSKTFLDPAIFKEGTEVTVTGLLSGEIKQLIGKKTLTLPLLAVENIHVWTERPQYNDRHYRHYPYYLHHPFYSYPYFGGNFYYDYY